MERSGRVRMRMIAGIMMLLVVTGLLAAGAAEEMDERETVWVLCNPKSFVNLREHPSGRSCVAGRAECGDAFITDGVKEKGFLHVIASVEAGDCWISERYIVYEEPQRIGETRVIESTGRVASRAYIGGRRNRWLRNGDEVKVYWMAEWAVTNKGFIRSEFIGEKTGGEKQ